MPIRLRRSISSGPRLIARLIAGPNRLVALVAFALALPLLAASARVAGADMRCEGRLVSPGDTRAELLLRCGEPDSQSIIGVIKVTDDGSRVLQAYVDEWSYPSAGTEPFRLLRFEAGRLVGDGMRCGGGLVEAGDTSARVLEVCGPPVSRDVAGSRDLPAAPARTPDATAASDRTEILVLQWVYRMGEGKFTRIVHLEGGRITEIIDGPRQ